ncbi:MAG: aminotransferase class V-fold PLP-dependent enzyme [Bacilli bacterium]|nr:aminotransferase class V-fold PLP-dependent enzyme [Bacilli bacterium]
MQNIEIEYKHLLNRKEYLLIRKDLINNFSFTQYHQINHYFNDIHDELKNKEQALRIREKNNTYEICLKTKRKDDVLEKNIMINKNDFLKIIDNPQCLNTYFNNMNLSLQYLGSLHTERLEVKVEQGLICLDLSHYFNKIDYEIEFEANDYDNEEYLKAFLSTYHINYQANQLSKIARYYEAYMNNNLFKSNIIANINKEVFNDNIDDIAQYIKKYASEVKQKPIMSELTNIDDQLNELPCSSTSILKELMSYENNIVNTNSPKYFGYVVGGILPSGLYAKLISTIWDQNSAVYDMSFLSNQLEVILEKWFIKLFDLPSETSLGLVRGSAGGNLLAINAALISLVGENREQAKIIISNQAHFTFNKIFNILGLKTSQLTIIDTDDQGRIKVDDITNVDDHTIIILQAGNLLTGSYDDFSKVYAKTKTTKAWIHIDGAFGLYVQACPSLRYLTKDLNKAHSWVCDGHKTLNTPYDCGMILCKDKKAYLNSLNNIMDDDDLRNSMDFTNDMSKRSQSIEIWASIKSLGVTGLGELVLQLHALSKYFAIGLSNIGFTIINEIFFNQILCFYEDKAGSAQLVKRINDTKVLYVNCNKWHGEDVMRISVTNYQTTYQDIDECLKIINDIVINSEI